MPVRYPNLKVAKPSRGTMNDDDEMIMKTARWPHGAGGHLGSYLAPRPYGELSTPFARKGGVGGVGGFSRVLTGFPQTSSSGRARGRNPLCARCSDRWLASIVVRAGRTWAMHKKFGHTIVLYHDLQIFATAIFWAPLRVFALVPLRWAGPAPALCTGWGALLRRSWPQVSLLASPVPPLGCSTYRLSHHSHSFTAPALMRFTSSPSTLNPSMFTGSAAPCRVRWWVMCPQ